MTRSQALLNDVADEAAPQTRQTPAAARAAIRALRESAAARAKPSPAERLALLAEVSAHAWVKAGGELPGYTRSGMPVVVTTLDGRRSRE
jgi:hypothetical protein